ncbi:VrrA/YqfQ family protein [Sporosarcina sp. FSL W8-0480]|uniref:VrrA/YqfQ family protein n=1 Tax=Sporosarcina sp. FSL W8-0480 TaxID=2954701 RepID=UPI0030D8CE65
MRYESFYPFARGHSSPYGFNQPMYGQHQPTYFGQPPRQPFQGSPMGNQFGPSMQQGQGPNIPKMEAYMQTANRFLTTAQQYAPLVQQIAPMFQNLPAMWRLYKGFQSLPSSGAAGGASAVASAVAGNAPSAAQGLSQGLSGPRIFQPPNL